MLRSVLAFVLAVSMMPSLAFAEEASTAVATDAVVPAQEVAAAAAADDVVSTEDVQDAEGIAVTEPATQVSDDAAVQTEEAPVAADQTVAEEQAVAEEQVATQDAGSVLAEGTYYISSALNARSVLDVSGATKENLGNVQIFATNTTAAQKWRVTVDDEGFATITNVNSGKVLDVADGKAANGTNVQQYESNGTKAQKWVVSKDSKGYKFTSALADKFVLDVCNASIDNGTNVQLFADNDSDAQHFTTTECDVPVVTGEQVFADGVYTVTSQLGDRVVDISGAGTQNGANAQIWDANGSLAQAFQFSFEEATGCYLITNVNSGQRLDADYANPINGTNVHQWPGNGADAQRWIAEENGDGSLTFTNRGSGKVLDVSGGKNNNGANLQTWEPNHSAAQCFTLSEYDLSFSGVYSIRTALAGDKFIDVPAASTANNVQLQLFQGNGSIAQKYVVKREGVNTISIRSIVSGLRVAEEGGKVVQQAASENANQKWTLSYSNGLVLTNNESGLVMDVTGGSSDNGAKIQMFAPNGTAAQGFYFSATDPIVNGCYSISPECAGGKFLDFSAGQWNDGTNLQIWEGNGGNAQKFDIIGVGGGYYRITSNMTWSNVDVSNGETVNGTNVQMWTMAGVDAQKWRIGVTEDGWYTFQNANGKYLDVAGAANRNGANVDIFDGNGSTAQKFRVNSTPTASVSGNATLDNNLRDTINGFGKSGDLMRKAYDSTCSRGYVGDVGPRYWGILNDDQTRDRALYMVNTGKGDCYCYAATMMWLARTLGYSSNVRAGAVDGGNGGRADHGWTEVYVNGETYVLDCNLQHDFPKYNWYFITYANAPINYYL